MQRLFFVGIINSMGIFGQPENSENRSVGKSDNRINQIIAAMLGVVGMGILVYGVWEQIKQGEVRVEVISGDSAIRQISDSAKQIVVDVAGAVEKAGVYQLQIGSRIGDALVVAGGLSASADREWVAKNLNLAQEVEDGGKIYVPLYRETPSQGKGVSLGEQTTNGLVNINTASLGELDTLTGIGEVRARAIIENRPYGSTEELMSKAKIPSSIYEKIKTSVSVY